MLAKSKLSFLIIYLIRSKVLVTSRLIMKVNVLVIVDNVRVGILHDKKTF